MIHRPTDSRLLTNLLSHEKEYTKQLSTVLEYSQASLSSFSAYASASPPPASQIILAVAGSIAGADEALHKYAASVDEWREQLKCLKDLEEEVGNIMRDREILVTRLIKASKQQKPNRDTFMSPPTSPTRGDGSSKLNAAQSELQACETHLANKERELDAMRISAVRVGLHARCTAMVECGWTWGEMGKEGIRALEQLDVPNGHIMSQSGPSPFKPLPDPQRPSSEISSILPSQSASQIALVSPSGQTVQPNNYASSSNPGAKPYSLQIPPAHSISELELPSQHVPQSPVDDGDSSSIDEDVGPLELHENERFTSGRSLAIGQKSKKSKEKAKLSNGNSHPYFSSKTHLPNGSPAKGKDRERKGSSSMFGTLAGLFHKSGTTKGRWQTRPAEDESDSENDSIQYHAVAPSQPANGHAQHPSNSSGGGRLKRTNKARASTVDNATFDRTHGASNGNLAPPQREHGSGGTNYKGKGRAATIDDVVLSDVKSRKSTTVRASLTRRASSSHPHLPLNAGGASLSRDSSLSKKSEMSSMSAPPAANVIFRPGSTASAHLSATPRKRTTSATVPKRAGVRANHTRSSSLDPGPVTLTPTQPNLMSIVEEAVRQNQVSRSLLNPNNRLESVKAPLSASTMLSREAEFHLAQMKPPPPVQRSPPPTRKSVTSSAAPAKVEVTVQKRLQPISQSKPPAAIAQPSELVAPVPHHAQALNLIGSAANKPLPTKLPLKSALRNQSRTPSPNPLTLNRSPAPGPIETSTSSPPPMKIPVSMTSQEQDDDTMSVSSYETVHETFESDSDDTIPPPPPPHDPHPVNGVVSSDISHSNSSGASGSGGDKGTTTRRKSVRMSLPPTYSATPPAIEDWEGDKNKYPWGPRDAEPDNRGWTSRDTSYGDKDIWEDSSEEDEEYSLARKMLGKIASRRH